MLEQNEHTAVTREGVSTSEPRGEKKVARYSDEHHVADAVWLRLRPTVIDDG